MDAEELWRAVFDIEQQASRHKRAVSLKRYLLHDLEVIEKRARALCDSLPQPEAEKEGSTT